MLLTNTQSYYPVPKIKLKFECLIDLFQADIDIHYWIRHVGLTYGPIVEITIYALALCMILLIGLW